MTYSHDSRWESHALRKSFDGFAKDLLEAIAAARSSPEVCDTVYGLLFGELRSDVAFFGHRNKSVQ
jgi:hypothetical protein